MDKMYRLIVDDKAGVLDRVVGLVRRFGENISFLVVFQMEGTNRSLLTFKLTGGIEVDSISRRLREIDSVHSLEVVEDSITDKIMEVAR